MPEPLRAPIHPLLLEGLAASRAGDASGALALFSSAAADAPAEPLPHFLGASEQAAAGNLALAEAGFARALLLAPAWALARYQLGLVQFAGGHPERALLTWAPLVAGNEPAYLSDFVHGFAALAADDMYAARRYFEAGLSRNLELEAINDDVRRVLGAIEGLPPLAESSPHASDAPAHVLVKNYQTGGRPE